MKTIVEKAQSEFKKVVDEFGSDPYFLMYHLPEVETWAYYMFRKYPNADKEIVLLSVWLHDIGHYPIPTEVDHAIRSEERAKEFLEKENYPKEKMQEVLHCVRSHRCSDVKPKTFESKILAFIDSASHITDTVYLRMIKESKRNNREIKVREKMDRDFRDLDIFPEVKTELLDLCNAWKKLINSYDKVDL